MIPNTHAVMVSIKRGKATKRRKTSAVVNFLRIVAPQVVGTRESEHGGYRIRRTSR